MHVVSKIVSGGQTGVDRAALDVAISLGLEHGGWCPSGRRAEDGRIPSCYQLRETESAEYAMRTERNVIDSDGTLILYADELSGGTKLTLRMAEKYGRPQICVDLRARDLETHVSSVQRWLSEQNIGVLNVAGPRESNFTGIRQLAENFLCRVFQPI